MFGGDSGTSLKSGEWETLEERSVDIWKSKEHKFTVLPAKSDSEVLFFRINTQVIYRFALAQVGCRSKEYNRNLHMFHNLFISESFISKRLLFKDGVSSFFKVLVNCIWITTAQ